MVTDVNKVPGKCVHVQSVNEQSNASSWTQFDYIANALVTHSVVCIQQKHLWVLGKREKWITWKSGCCLYILSNLIFFWKHLFYSMEIWYRDAHIRTLRYFKLLVASGSRSHLLFISVLRANRVMALFLVGTNWNIDENKQTRRLQCAPYISSRQTTYNAKGSRRIQTKILESKF
jgi:hypothetical protein